MRVEDNAKCEECGSRNLENDESRGEIVCEDCGLVQQDKAIDFAHPEGRVGEGAQNTATRNDVGSNKLGSRIDPVEARRAGMGNLVKTQVRSHSKKNERANEVLAEIKQLTDSKDIHDAAKELLETGFVDKRGINLTKEDLGELPRNQMRFMHEEEKDATYVIRCSAIATLMVLSDIGNIPYRFWKLEAREHSISENDCLKAKKIINRRLDRAVLGGITGLRVIRDPWMLRRRALDAWSERLRAWIHTRGIDGAQAFLDWVEMKRKELDMDGEGRLGQENPDMLLAMIATVALSELATSELTKKSLAEEVFLLTVGGVNARLKQRRNLIKDSDA